MTFTGSRQVTLGSSVPAPPSAHPRRSATLGQREVCESRVTGGLDKYGDARQIVLIR